MNKTLRGKLRNWLLPKPVFYYDGKQVARCISDGMILSWKDQDKGFDQELLSQHPGHQFKQPIILTMKEKLLLRLGIL